MFFNVLLENLPILAMVEKAQDPPLQIGQRGLFIGARLIEFPFDQVGNCPDLEPNGVIFRHSLTSLNCCNANIIRTFVNPVNRADVRNSLKKAYKICEENLRNERRSQNWLRRSPSPMERPEVLDQPIHMLLLGGPAGTKPDHAISLSRLSLIGIDIALSQFLQ